MTLEEFIEDWQRPEPKLLVHTSGSTGKPKPMWVEKQKMLQSARITCDFLGLLPGDSALLCMPLDYIAGKMMVVRSIERQLKLISVEPSLHPLAEVTDDLRFVAMVPAQVFATLDVPAERERLCRVDHLIIGGGAISAELQQKLQALPTDGAIWSTYGMTETLSHIALRRLNGPLADDWYTPFDSVTIGQTPEGCLTIQAPLVHDGLLVTNDLVEICDGRFRILGRRDNIICSGGIKLQIERIEEKLRPALPVPYCITRRPDPQFGEVVVLLLAGSVSSDLLTSAFSRLDRYEVPKHLLQVDTIPYTATGKISRAEAERLAERPLII